MSALAHDVNSFDITPSLDESEPAEESGHHGQLNHPSIVSNSEDARFIDVAHDIPDVRPSEVKIADLYECMPGNRATLLAVINLCEKPTAEQEVRACVAELQEHSASVYSGWNICKQLEKAGGIVHVRENGDPYDEESLEPRVFEEDGETYIQAVEPPASYWVSTPVALAFAKTQEPSVLFADLIDNDSDYACVYKFVLEQCARGGVSAKELAAVIDKHPMMQEPRYYASHFVKRLENAGVIAWKGQWVLAPYGEEALEKLANVESLA